MLTGGVETHQERNKKWMKFRKLGAAVFFLYINMDFTTKIHILPQYFFRRQ